MDPGLIWAYQLVRNLPLKVGLEWADWGAIVYYLFSGTDQHTVRGFWVQGLGLIKSSRHGAQALGPSFRDWG